MFVKINILCLSGVCLGPVYVITACFIGHCAQVFYKQTLLNDWALINLEMRQSPFFSSTVCFQNRSASIRVNECSYQNLYLFERLRDSEGHTWKDHKNEDWLLTKLGTMNYSEGPTWVAKNRLLEPSPAACSGARYQKLKWRAETER